jgi:hypothetical protein
MSKLETNKYQATRIFRQAKEKSQSLFSQREVPTRIVNQVIGYRAFEEPKREQGEGL